MTNPVALLNLLRDLQARIDAIPLTAWGSAPLAAVRGLRESMECAARMADEIEAGRAVDSPRTTRKDRRQPPKSIEPERGLGAHEQDRTAGF